MHTGKNSRQTAKKPYASGHRIIVSDQIKTNPPRSEAPLPNGGSAAAPARRPGKTTSKISVPPRLRGEVEKILFTDRQIARRIKSLAREIEEDFRGREMVVVSLLNGTVLFLADLIRHLNLPLRLDFIGVSSYGAGTESGELVFTKELRLDVRERDVLLVDDILDTGKTLSRVIPKLQALKPRRIRTCVLLDKPARRRHQVEADYVGFEIPDFFVIGYGLDFAERYRNLPFVGVLHPHIYQPPNPPRPRTVAYDDSASPCQPPRLGGHVAAGVGHLLQPQELSLAHRALGAGAAIHTGSFDLENALGRETV